MAYWLACLPLMYTGAYSPEYNSNDIKYIVNKIRNYIVMFYPNSNLHCLYLTQYISPTYLEKMFRLCFLLHNKKTSRYKRKSKSTFFLKTFFLHVPIIDLYYVLYAELPLWVKDRVAYASGSNSRLCSFNSYRYS